MTRVMIMKKQKNKKTRMGTFKNMVGNFPGGNFLGGNFRVEFTRGEFDGWEFSRWEFNFIKKGLQHRCCPVNIAKFFKNSFFIEHLS